MKSPLFVAATLLYTLLLVPICWGENRGISQSSFSQKINQPLVASYSYMLGTWREARTGESDFIATYHTNGTADWISDGEFSSWHGIWWIDIHGDFRTIATPEGSDYLYYTEHEKITPTDKNISKSSKQTTDGVFKETIRWRIKP